MSEQAVRAVHAVVAIARGGAIGLNGGLPWPRIREDMAHFRALTMGKAVIMGRSTWESLPEKYRPLPGRMNIVVSRTLDEIDAGFVVHTIEDAIALARAKDRTPFIIGGAQIYAAAAPLVDRWHINRIGRDVEADTFFDPNLAAHACIDAEELLTDVIAETWVRA